MSTRSSTFKRGLMGGATALLACTLAPSAFAQNMLSNGGFEADQMPNYGNNTQYNSPLPSGWTFVTGDPNIVRVDGPGGQATWYNTGPESDASGSPAGTNRQYLDGLGSVRFYQTFTANCTGPMTFSGSFSGRGNRGRGSFTIRSGSSLDGPQLAAPVSVSTPGGAAMQTPWIGGTTTANVVQGQTYTYDVSMDNQTNFDEAKAMPERNCRPYTPPPPVPSGEHFQCYAIRKGDALRRETILIQDQFGEGKAVLGVPTMLCNPATKTHRGKTFEMRDKERHLVCYTYVVRPEVKQQELHVNTQFGDDKVTSYRPEMFCAPAGKAHLDGEGKPDPIRGIGRQDQQTGAVPMRSNPVRIQRR